MDAHAHLLALGWAGPGHSLDSRPPVQHKGRRGLAYNPTKETNTGRGLIKPLLVTQKKNTFGIGKRSHEPAAGNEWWLKGFENALSNIGKKGDIEAKSGTATPDGGITYASGYRGRHAGLYGFFTKGQQMEGTIKDETPSLSRGKKRKSDTFDDEETSSTGSGISTHVSAVSHQNLTSNSRATADFARISQFMEARDKDRKRGQRRVMIDPTEEFDQVGQLFGAATEREKDGRRRPNKDPLDLMIVEEDNIVEASKELRRRGGKEATTKLVDEETENPARKHRRKVNRGAQAGAKSSPPEKEHSSSSLNNCSTGDVNHEQRTTSADEALRKAERKRRKKQRQLAKQQVDF